jgi:hypothetical protein
MPYLGMILPAMGIFGVRELQITLALSGGTAV